MSLNNVTPGKNAPDTFNVVIEIPMNADPVKYEVDKETGAIFVDRFMTTAMHYPTNYGYVPQTLSGDGDPVDVLVITPYPLFPGVVVPCRPLGILMMEDEAGVDGKVIAVPTSKVQPQRDQFAQPCRRTALKNNTTDGDAGCDQYDDLRRQSAADPVKSDAAGDEHRDRTPERGNRDRNEPDAGGYNRACHDRERQRCL